MTDLKKEVDVLNLTLAKELAQKNVRELRLRKPRLNKDSIDVILNDVHSRYAWIDKPITKLLLMARQA